MALSSNDVGVTRDWFEGDGWGLAVLGRTYDASDEKKGKTRVNFKLVEVKINFIVVFWTRLRGWLMYRL